MKKYLSFILLVFIFVGCSNEDMLTDMPENGKQKRIETLTFKFKGITYVADCEKSDDGSIYILNEDVQSVYNAIMSLPNLVQFVKVDGSMEFFDCEEDMEKYLAVKPKLKSTTFTGISHYNVQFYKETDYMGLPYELQGNTVEDGSTNVIVPYLPSGYDANVFSFRLTLTREEGRRYPTNACTLRFFSSQKMSGYKKEIEISQDINIAGFYNFNIFYFSPTFIKMTKMRSAQVLIY